VSTFGLQPTDLPVPCQTFQCYGRAAYFLGRSDAPAGTTQLVCVQCAQELKDQIFKELNVVEVEALPFTDIEPTEDPMTDYSELKVAELKDLAESEGIKVPSKATKSEIISLLEEADHE
jgi:hypothetical protein